MPEWWQTEANFGLVARWADVANAWHILKTNLFQEAVGQVQFLFDAAQLNGNVIGIDISSEVVDQAKRRATDIGMDAS
jgi:ubiquinone/menaquinone biosynthesis C-methylase UbiE